MQWFAKEYRRKKPRDELIGTNEIGLVANKSARKYLGSLDQ